VGEGLPIPATTLFGREEEIAAIERLLADERVRLVTLVGPGGVGKTRLALAVAAHAADAVRFVPLAPIADPSLVPHAVMRGLGLEPIPGVPVADILASSLAGQRLLLLVDNVEHLVEGTALFAELLARCPSLRLLATSRVPLEITGEHLVRVRPLPLPDDAASRNVAVAGEFAAVQLFVDRAVAVFPEFRLTSANVREVAEICHRLDGLPLAIELAASRSGQFSPRTLADRLAQRISLLGPGPRDAPSRHRTIRATVEWSVDLLPERERALWRWLGLCEGGFSVEMAEAFAPLLGVERDEIAPMLQTLTRHSLLVQTSGHAGEPRALMLETTRQVAHAAVADDPRLDEVWEAIATHLEDFCAKAEPGLMGPDGAAWFHRVEDELPGIRSVLMREQDRGEIGRSLRMLGDIGWFWTDPAYVAEGRAWLEPLLAKAGEDIPPAVHAKAADTAAMLAGWHNDQDAARAFGTTAISLWRDLGDDGRIAASAINLGNVDLDLLRYDDADRWFRVAHDHAERAGDVWLIAASANLRGVVAGMQGRPRDAIGWHQTAVRLWETAGFDAHVLVALQSLGWTLMWAGEGSEARRAFLRILELAGDAHRVPDVHSSIFGAALLAHDDGRDALAVRLLEVGLREREAMGLPVRPHVQESIDTALTRLRESLGEIGFTRAWNEGRTMSFTEAVAAARTVLGEGGEMMDALSHRERDVLSLMMDGASDEEIARDLYISRRTASKHVASILEKLGAPNRTAAVSIAIRKGVV
jgi:predicted ATPase/DNA-binding CsgD family transcriptional regulator